MRPLVFFCALAATGCVGDSLSFNCSPTRSCGTGGTCVNGACAFNAADCPSGLRFDKSAGSLGGKCVDASNMLDFAIDPRDLAGVDFSGVDFAMSIPDLAGADFAGVDFSSVPDLTQPPPDLTTPCVPTGAEDCFNNLDDDCDGKIDCADTDCTPIAECVPDAPGAQLGAEVAIGNACPTHYAGAAGVPIGQGLNVPGGCSGCACSGSIACATTLRERPGASCPSTTTVASWALDSNSCTVISLTTKNAGADPFVAAPTCSAAGAPMVPPSSFTTNTQFCQTTQIGGGCAAGNVCVAKTGGPKHCTLDAANATCKGSYAPESGGQWFKSINDTRDCGALCFCGSPSGGSCGAGSFVKLFSTASTCVGPSAGVNPGADTCGLPSTNYQSATIVLSGQSAPSCQVGNSVSGTATAAGQQTLCCL